MKIKQIRSATNKIFYGGKTFLLDPWLVEQYGLGCFDSMPGNPYMAVDPVKEKIPMPVFFFAGNGRKHFKWSRCLYCNASAP